VNNCVFKVWPFHHVKRRKILLPMPMDHSAHVSSDMPDHSAKV
jgi:hypothetical protein